MVTAALSMSPSALLTLLLAAQSLALALALAPDPSGASKVGNGAHQSSIGSQCASSLDCGANGNTACCAFLPQAGGGGGATIGICSGCGATTQQGKQGCGFGDAGKTSLAADPQVCPASSFAQGSAPGSSSSSSSPSSSSGEASPAQQQQQQQQQPPPPAAAAAAAPSAPSGCAGARARRSTKRERRAAAHLLAADLRLGLGRRAQQQQQQQQQQQPLLLPDPALDAGAGNGRHAQFVTGRCAGAADCGAGQADLSQVCCAGVPDAATGGTVGVCSGSAVGAAAPKTGCGFGDGLATSAAAAIDPACEQQGSAAAAAAASPEAAAAAAAAAAGASAAKLPDPGLDAGKGNQQNKQFVTGACINAKDCGASQTDLANVCCASVMSGGQVVGVCSGSAVGNAAPKMGCGFGDGKANAAA